MMIGKIILLLIWFGVIPLLMGMLYTFYSGKNQDSWILQYCSGLIMMLAVTQIVIVPLIFLRKGMTTATVLICSVYGILCLISLWKNYRQIGKWIKNVIKQIANCPWTVWIAVILILFQTFVLTTQQHIDDDDSFYVGTAVTSVHTGGLYAVNPYTGEAYEELPMRYVLSPFPGFQAVTSVVTGVHPTLLTHTVLPIVLIPFVYLIYALLGEYLFKRESWKTGYLLILVSVLHMFSGYSVYTAGTFLLVRIWQGKALLAAGLLPSVYYYAFRAFESERKIIDYVMLTVLMLACCHVSSMGIMLGAIALGIAGISWSIRYRSLRVLLYGMLCCIPNMIYAVMYLCMK